ncbi:glucose-1-phosphate adenylyltransferase family protein [Hymenobacter weizhouensis]|uniref:glucose-1-phosphate adenylyltransferase family protein n=1 Tax=Hymenobacter sp. YIM 151500-1 TaxID=2987689 RepID=UPI0022277890|nr:glucose-1-phosphate adenylyltransferase family protein [Hymenobacter sp. YIM 151500-1]UYZ65052.1 glucose-1-phosphate adenylyltransferase [Hymenobacter sp. YIM 151500-1]
MDRTPTLTQARGTRLFGKKVLALVLAGGKGSRMGPLTEHRAKPALPFAGTYKLIDFALSNCVNSGIFDVWVLEEYELHTLNDHLSNGRPWDLDRTYGGLRVLPPYTGGPEAEEGGFASGNADAIYKQLPLLKDYAPDVLVVLSADHLYTLNLADVVEAHLRRKASITMVTTTVPPREDATRFGNVVLEANDRVKNFVYKPEKPVSDDITTEVFVYDVPTLVRTLERLEREQDDLEDFGHHLLPALVEEGQAYAYRFRGYWRDVGLPEAYLNAHLDLLAGRGVDLAQPDWPLYTLTLPRPPARIERGAVVENSLVAPGCRVAGTVRRCVLGPDVTVEAGATLDDCVLLGRTHVAAGVQLKRIIVDQDLDLPKNFQRLRTRGVEVLGAEQLKE